jgi:2,3-bisphosphoglycerate-dependent phosphoglycerate mutase
VRHSETRPVPGVASNQWPLSDEGRRRCHTLAERLKAYDLERIVTSTESKAAETGQLVADMLHIPTVVAADLHEHDRSNSTTFYANAQDFKAIMADLFDKPQTLVYGCETADQAHARFANAVHRVVEMYSTGNRAIVTHATVLTLFVSRLAGLEPFAFWERLGMPAYVALSLPDFRLLETIENV